jgi:hypothetical protein
VILTSAARSVGEVRITEAERPDTSAQAGGGAGRGLRRATRDSERYNLRPLCRGYAGAINDMPAIIIAVFHIVEIVSTERS